MRRRVDVRVWCGHGSRVPGVYATGSGEVQVNGRVEVGKAHVHGHIAWVGEVVISSWGLGVPPCAGELRDNLEDRRIWGCREPGGVA